MTLPKKAKARPKPKPKKKRPLGRKPDFISAAQTDALCSLIAKTVSTKAACQKLGLNERTVYNWLEKGELENADPVYVHFRQRITQARGEAKAAGTELIRKAAIGTRKKPGDWRALAWLLERIYPDDFRPPDKIQHEVKGSIQHDHTHKQIVVVMPAAIAHPRPIRQIEARKDVTEQPPENPAP